MRRILVGVVAAGALAMPATAAAQEPPRDSGKPQNPGCFGDLVSTGGQTGLLGEFVSTNAQRFKGNDGDSIGEDGVPFFKFVSCPGDYRGRQSLDDQP